ncbi:hypothetical protein OIU77_002799 [Salix suchowensis]|uniref:Uncharacterized protein n=1 Tax=Salix suchowensis TaxID=1278906 RepID=A0ABQ9AXF7_9ROSI|nr:hypothetical protein OIU77_002799 [Salix suchowensis]
MEPSCLYHSLHIHRQASHPQEHHECCAKDGVRVLFLVVLVILYSVGLLYITIVWHLASVISVLEDFYGIKAMMKSKELIKGKMGIAAAVFIVVGICFVGIQFLFETFVVLGWPVEIRIAMGLLCLLLLFKVILFGLVIQTVLYFVCKSYHHENIDKSSLSDHLEVYLGEYVPSQIQGCPDGAV